LYVGDILSMVKLTTSYY